MTKDVKKMKYAEAKALYEDSSALPELRAQAKDRMDSIRAWLDSKGKSSGGGGKFERRPIQESDFDGLSAEQKQGISEDAEKLLQAQLCRIYAIEQGLSKRGIPATGVFVGMLYNNQVAVNN